MLLAISEAENVYTTRFYDYRIFAPGNLFMPIVTH